MSYLSARPLLRKFDATWDEIQRQDAILAADHQALQAKADLDQAIKDVNVAVDRYTEALAWKSQIRACADRVGTAALGENLRENQ